MKLKVFLVLLLLIIIDGYAKTSNTINLIKNLRTKANLKIKKSSEKSQTFSSKKIKKNPGFIADRLSKYVSVILMKIASVYLNVAIQKVEQLKMGVKAKHKAFLAEKNKEMDDLLESDCLFYRFLKYTTNAHLHSLDFQLNIIKGISIRKVTFDNESEKKMKKIFEKLIDMKQVVIRVLEQKTIETCSVEKVGDANIQRSIDEKLVKTIRNIERDIREFQDTCLYLFDKMNNDFQDVVSKSLKTEKKILSEELEKRKSKKTIELEKFEFQISKKNFMEEALTSLEFKSNFDHVFKLYYEFIKNEKLPPNYDEPADLPSPIKKKSNSINIQKLTRSPSMIQTEIIEYSYEPPSGGANMLNKKERKEFLESKNLDDSKKEELRKVKELQNQKEEDLEYIQKISEEIHVTIFKQFGKYVPQDQKGIDFLNVALSKKDSQIIDQKRMENFYYINRILKSIFNLIKASKSITLIYYARTKADDLQGRLIKVLFNYIKNLKNFFTLLSSIEILQEAQTDVYELNKLRLEKKEHIFTCGISLSAVVLMFHSSNIDMFADAFIDMDHILNINVASFEAMKTMLKLAKIWDSHYNSKMKLLNEQTLVESYHRLFKINSKFKKCQTMGIIMDIAKEQDILLQSLENLVEDNWEKFSIIEGDHGDIIKEFILKLCKNEIDLCRTSFSMEYIKEILKEKSDGILNDIIYLRYFGPISSISISQNENDEVQLMSMGYTFKSLIGNTNSKLFICRSCNSKFRIYKIFQIEKIDGSISWLRENLKSIISEKENFAEEELESSLITESSISLKNKEGKLIKYFFVKIEAPNNLFLDNGNIKALYSVDIQIDSENRLHLKPHYQNWNDKELKWEGINKETDFKFKFLIVTDKSLKCEAIISNEKLKSEGIRILQKIKGYLFFGITNAAWDREKLLDVYSDYDCKILYLLDLMENQNIHTNENYEFFIDSVSKKSMYLSNNFQLISFLYFSFDESADDLYFIYYRNLFPNFSIEEEYNLIYNPKILKDKKRHKPTLQVSSVESENKNSLYHYLNNYICSRGITASQIPIFANCLFQDDPLNIAELTLKNINQIKDVKELELISYSYNQLNPDTDPDMKELVKSKKECKIFDKNEFIIKSIKKYIFKLDIFQYRLVNELFEGKKIKEWVLQFENNPNESEFYKQFGSGDCNLLVYFQIYGDNCENGNKRYLVNKEKGSKHSPYINVVEKCTKEPIDIPIERLYYARLSIGKKLPKSVFTRKNAHKHIVNHLDGFFPLIDLSEYYKVGDVYIYFDYLVKPNYNIGFVPLFDKIHHDDPAKDSCYKYFQLGWKSFDKLYFNGRRILDTKNFNLFSSMILMRRFYQFENDVDALNTFYRKKYSKESIKDTRDWVKKNLKIPNINHLRQIYFQDFLTSSYEKVTKDTYTFGEFLEEFQYFCLESNHLRKFFLPVKLTKRMNTLIFRKELPSPVNKEEIIYLEEAQGNEYNKMNVFEIYYVELILKIPNSPLEPNFEEMDYKLLKDYGYTPLFPDVPKRSENPKEKNKDFKVFSNDAIMRRKIKTGLKKTVVGWRVWIRYDNRLNGNYNDVCKGEFFTNSQNY